MSVYSQISVPRIADFVWKIFSKLELLGKFDWIHLGLTWDPLEDWNQRKLDDVIPNSCYCEYLKLQRKVRVYHLNFMDFWFNCLPLYKVSDWKYWGYNMLCYMNPVGEHFSLPGHFIVDHLVLQRTFKRLLQHELDSWKLIPWGEMLFF